MASITFRWTGDGIARLKTAAASLADNGKRNTAFRRAINHTGDKAFTRTKRELAAQIGASQSIILRYGKIRKARAFGSNLEFQIIAKGGPIPLKYFKARQGAGGVSASPWNHRKLYHHAFIVPSLRGNAFWRKGSGHLPIKGIAGPNVPKEMVKDAVAAAFEALVSTDLPSRVEHEVRVLTNGVVS
jgi:hypothetical protein